MAEKTLKVLKRCVPAAVPGIAFLSGGQSSEDATAHLHYMNATGALPWKLTFSYGRALQADALKAWGGKPENVAAGQRAFSHRAKMNALACHRQMGPVAGEGGLIPRLFLVAPERPAALLAACLEAACEAGDVASLLVSPSTTRELVALAQSKGVAVLTTDATAATRLGCDGIHVDSSAEAVAGGRRAVGKNGIVGAFAGASRHLAMEAAEAGADYIACRRTARPSAANRSSNGGPTFSKFHRSPSIPPNCRGSTHCCRRTRTLSVPPMRCGTMLNHPAASLQS